MNSVVLADGHFELIEKFKTSYGGIARIWRDRITGEYFSSYVLGSRLILTRPTEYLRFARDDVYASYYKKVAR